MISEAWLRLLVAAGHGGSRWLEAIRTAGGADALLSTGSPAMRRAGLRADDRRRLASSSTAVPAAWRDWLDRPDHALVVYGSPAYPPRLAEMDDAPLALWITGADPGLLAEPQLAIVGSRHPTQNGRLTAESLAASVSDSGLTVTSGLAIGIDAASHRGALGGLGKTIAVLGSGIDSIYPAANRGLAAEIAANGLLISEYAPGTPVRAGHFPRRNRIIAGLSLGTVVIEATRRSGSLITARLAGECGREVFAVPGSIHSALSKGCHKLLRDGAKLVEDCDDILIEIAPQLLAATQDTSDRKSTVKTGELPEFLTGVLDYSPVSLDSLVSATGLTAAELSSMLLHLEIQGKIEALPGGRYCRLAKRA